MSNPLTSVHVKKGEIIRQIGIENVLKEMGYKENSDFMFLRSNTSFPYIFTNQTPSYALWLISGQTQNLVINNETGAEIPMITEGKLLASIGTYHDGKIKYGVIANNNGIAAIYIPNQGIILTRNYDLMFEMENSFYLEHDNNLFVPLSNGEKFQNSTLQKAWENIKQIEERKNQINSTKQPSEQEIESEKKHKYISGAIEKLETKLDKTKLDNQLNQFKTIDR